MAFIDNLRMAGIFGGSKPMGMPDLSAGGVNLDEISNIMNRMTPYIQRSKEEDRNFQEKMFNMQRQAHLQDIAHQLTQQGQQQLQPMNQVVGHDPNSMNDYQKAEINLKKQELSQKTGVAGSKDENADLDRAIRQQRANTYSSMHDMSDSEKLDVINRARSGDIQARGMIQRDLLDTRGTQATELQGIKQTGAEKIQGMQGEQGLANIAARIQGQQQLQDTKPGKDMLPTQVKVDQANKARQLINTNPDLAPFIQFDSSGNFTIQQPGKSFWGTSTGPTSDQIKKIQDSIYTEPTKPEVKKAAPVTKPETKKTEAPKSKYAVTIK
jgi:hypothetical protein